MFKRREGDVHIFFQKTNSLEKKLTKQKKNQPTVFCTPNKKIYLDNKFSQFF